MIERAFVKQAMMNLSVTEFLKEHLKKAQISHVDIQRTPLSTRVIIYCALPRVVIGRRGNKINDLTRILEKEFGLHKPHIDVRAVENPLLDAAVVARRIAEDLERGKKYRSVAQKYLRRIMDAGAYGAEIRISGKLSGERARSEVFRIGYLKKCGEPAKENVDRAQDYVVLKQGKIGIKVAIMVSLPEVALLEKNIKGMSPTTQAYYEEDAEKLEAQSSGEEIEEVVEEVVEESVEEQQESQEENKEAAQ